MRTVTQGNAFAGSLLEASAGGLAGMAAGLLLERDRAVAEQFGESAVGAWKGHFEQHLRELAVALASGAPELFVRGVEWSRDAYAARQVPETALRRSLECLGEVLREQLPPAASGPATEVLERGIEALDAPRSAPQPALDPADPSAGLALRFLERALVGDALGAVDLLVDAQDGEGLSTPRLLLDVLVPAQREIGRMWHADEVDVAEEHVVTAATQRALAVLSQRTPRKPDNGLGVLVAAAPGDAHDIGVRVIADLFAFEGWRAVCLGADVPQSALVRAVRHYAPRLLVLAAALPVQVPALREAIEAIRPDAGQEGVRVLVGGTAFDAAPDLWRSVGADGYAATLHEAVAQGASLLASD